MRSLAKLTVICIAAALVACSAAPATPPPIDEDCEAAGDEDGNGPADCDDPACADTAACEPRCGNGERETGERCDDGNATDGDGCDGNCTATACGNGVVTAGEACDDGNATDGDGCDGSVFQFGDQTNQIAAQLATVAAGEPRDARSIERLDNRIRGRNRL